MPLSTFTWSGRPGNHTIYELVETLAGVFPMEKKSLRAMMTELRAGPPELADIGTRCEIWRLVGKVEISVTRESDWDWHDLRGMFWRDVRVQFEVKGLGAGEQAGFRVEHGELKLSLALSKALFTRVMKALRSGPIPETTV